jgi:hypothetical protein
VQTGTNRDKKGTSRDNNWVREELPARQSPTCLVVSCSRGQRNQSVSIAATSAFAREGIQGRDVRSTHQGKGGGDFDAGATSTWARRRPSTACRSQRRWWCSHARVFKGATTAQHRSRQGRGRRQPGTPSSPVLSVAVECLVLEIALGLCDVTRTNWARRTSTRPAPPRKLRSLGRPFPFPLLARLHLGGPTAVRSTFAIAVVEATPTSSKPSVVLGVPN